MSIQPEEPSDPDARVNDPAPESPVGQTTRRVIEGAEQQVGAGEAVGSQESEAHDSRATKDVELDDALDDSFPASDPPSQTTKGRIK